MAIEILGTDWKASTAPVGHHVPLHTYTIVHYTRAHHARSLAHLGADGDGGWAHAREAKEAPVASESGLGGSIRAR